MQKVLTQWFQGGLITLLVSFAGISEASEVPIQIIGCSLKSDATILGERCEVYNDHAVIYPCGQVPACRTSPSFINKTPGYKCNGKVRPSAQISNTGSSLPYEIKSSLYKTKYFTKASDFDFNASGNDARIFVFDDSGEAKKFADEVQSNHGRSSSLPKRFVITAKDNDYLAFAFERTNKGQLVSVPIAKAIESCPTSPQSQPSGPNSPSENK